MPFDWKRSALFDIGLLANSGTAALLDGIALVVLLMFLKHD